MAPQSGQTPVAFSTPAPHSGHLCAGLAGAGLVGAGLAVADFLASGFDFDAETVAATGLASLASGMAVNGAGSVLAAGAA